MKNLRRGKKIKKVNAVKNNSAAVVSLAKQEAKTKSIVERSSKEASSSAAPLKKKAKITVGESSNDWIEASFIHPEDSGHIISGQLLSDGNIDFDDSIWPEGKEVITELNSPKRKSKKKSSIPSSDKPKDSKKTEAAKENAENVKPCQTKTEKKKKKNKKGVLSDTILAKVEEEFAKLG